MAKDETMNIGLTSTEFIMLLPIVVLLYYLFPCRLRGYCLLVINLLFYLSFGEMGVAIIFVETIIIYVTSICIKKSEKYIGSIVVCGIGITLLTMILLFYRVAGKIGISVMAPIGVSFYTMAAISYLVDVKRGQIEHESNVIKLIIWLSFFPVITAGPIYRYKGFKEEYERNTQELHADYERIITGIIYMLYGYFLKQRFNSIILIIISISYTMQIYTDFAGYSAIVIGIAQILGFYVPENFKAPYLAKSVKEFWSRWHISLSSWLKDYVYIPLGGNRKGPIRKNINIFLTFLVSALWHGWGFHFLVWGSLHALYQIVESLFEKSKGLCRQKQSNFTNNEQNSGFKRCLYRFCRTCGTFILVSIAWIFFRTGVNDAVFYIQHIFLDLSLTKEDMWLFVGMGIEARDWIVLGISLIVVIVTDALVYNNIRVDKAIYKSNYWVRALYIIFFSLMILMFGVYGDQHDVSYFIYRDF